MTPFFCVGPGLAPAFVLLDIARFMQFAVNGLVVGSVFALAAVGLTLVYGILRIANFAHGDFLTFGAYLALYFAALLVLPATLTWGLVVAGLLIGFVVFERVLRPRWARWRGMASTPGAASLLSPREAEGLLFVAAVLLALVAGTWMPFAVAGATGLFLAAFTLALAMTLRAVVVGDASARRRALFAIAAGLVVALAAHFLVALQSPGGWPLAGEAGLGLAVVAAGAIGAIPEPGRDRVVRAAVAVAGLIAAFLLASRMLLAVALALALVAAFAVVFDLVVWRRARSQGAGILSLIIISIGLALALRHAIQMMWGPQPRFFPGTFQAGERILGTSVLITPHQALTVGITVVLILLLHLFLRYTRTGKAMRALADNMELARVSGIDVDRVVLYVWIIAGTMAATAGILYAMLGAFTTNLGWFQILPIFAAVILGGIGSAYGALVGGFTIGLVMETSIFFGVPSEYRLAVAFGVLILVLVFRPTGLFGGAAAR